jgi:hypothetical protein
MTVSFIVPEDVTEREKDRTVPGMTPPGRVGVQTYDWFALSVTSTVPAACAAPPFARAVHVVGYRDA